MVKGGIAILLIGFGVLIGVYYFGGYAGWDPAERCSQAKAAISPGMRWAKVVDAAGEPGKYQLIRRDVQKGPFGDVEVRVPGLERQFDRALLEQDIAKGNAPEGFTLNYVFSQSEAFRVWFDSSGFVERIEESRFMDVLMQTQDD